MSKSPNKESVFGLSGEQIRRLLAIGYGEEPNALEPPSSAAAAERKAAPNAAAGSELSLQVDGYEVIAKVAEAGQGQVWRARQQSTGRDVAIKVPKLGSVTSERARIRFEREIELAARLKHPNIARVYDSGVDRGQYYYVMDFVEGLKLDDYVRQHKLTHRQILELMRTICQAVQHAHQNGVIHRDLKPSNLIVTDDGRPFIVDFGLAKGFLKGDENLVVSIDGETVGTPAYMSPEQAAGHTDQVDTRTDVYSLGVTLFSLLTGSNPHDLSGSHLEVMRRIADQEVRRPRTLNRNIDKDIEALLLKALDKDPDRRYSSAAGLTEDIDHYLKGEPLMAGSPSNVYRLRKFVKRNKLLVASIAAVLVILIAGVVTSTLFAIGQARARVEAQSVSDFLRNSVLALIDPYQTATEEITRRSLLDDISENLEQDFTGPPFAEAQIRQTLGVAYWSIGAYESAASHFERAIEVCQVHLGPEHPTTLEWRVNLGWTYMYQSRFRKAEPLLKKTLEDARRVLSDEHMQTASSMWSLGNLYWHQGRYEKAEPLLEKALEISVRQGGQEDRLTVAIMCGVAWVYWSQGRYEQAEQLSGKALAINLEERGPQENWTLSLKFQLGAICWTLGRYEQAERYMREALDGDRSVFGEENVHTLWTMCGMGIVYHSRGRYEDAELLLNEALTTAQRVLGDTHVIAAYSSHRLGTVYLSQERYEEAEPLLENALKTMSSLLGEDHPWTLDIKSDFGVLRYQQQRYAEAESLLREALDRRRRKLGQDHPACFESEHELAMLYMAQSQFTEAEPRLRRAFHGREAKLGPEHPDTLDSLRELVRLYESWNKPDEAAKWRAKLPEIENVGEQD